MRLGRNKREKTNRVSPIRLAIAATAMAALGLAGVAAAQHSVDRFAARQTVPFAPYVDVTLPPLVHFEDASTISAGLISLGFIVAGNDPCQPSWGSYYTLDAASRALDLDRRITNLRQQGGDVVVSFGGQANQELAVSCTDVDALTDAYRTVIDQYDAVQLDFDIEGTAMADQAANERRLVALARLQDERSDLEIWFTVPVAPHGLTAEGLDVARSAIGSDVDIAGINLMTMNYGESRAPGATMAAASIDALNSTFQQLQATFVRAGVPRDSVWSRLGATPMLGQNDVASDVFTVADAHALTEYASKVGLGRLGMWSINRDVACGPASPVGVAQNHCSGLDQINGELGRIFGNVAVERTDERTSQTSGRDEPDDPSASPYPIWRSAAVYDEGDKIVWHRQVYEAKWWSQGDLPDEPVDETWDTPWRYLGPVLDTDIALIAERPPVLDGAWQAWHGERAYVAGDEIRHRGHVYEALWWSNGEEPSVDPDQPFDHPWKYLGEAVEAPVIENRPVLDGTFERWNADQTFKAGETVQIDGQVFSAQWANDGIQPEFEPVFPFEHPWRYLGETPVIDISGAP